jgi:hypothetical protein
MKIELVGEGSGGRRAESDDCNIDPSEIDAAAAEAREVGRASVGPIMSSPVEFVAIGRVVGAQTPM